METALGSLKPWAPGAVLTPPIVCLGGERHPLGTRAAIPHCSPREVQDDRSKKTRPQRSWGQARDHSVGLTRTSGHGHTHTHTHAPTPASHLVRGALSGTRPLPHTRSQSESKSLIAVWGAAGTVTPRKVRRAPSPRCPCRAAAPAAGSATGHLPPRGRAARSPGRCRESRQR